MPFSYRFKPAHKEIKRYYEELGGYATREVVHEGATSTAFQTLLATTCKKADWHLVPQLATKIRGRQVRPDGTLRDDFNLHRGYWEAEDSSDKLDSRNPQEDPPRLSALQHDLRRHGHGRPLPKRHARWSPAFA